MGVLACDRPECTNIMCDYLIHDRYVCNECVSEFKDSVGDKPMTKIEMAVKFEAFIVTPKVEAYKFVDRHERHEMVTADDYVLQGCRR